MTAFNVEQIKQAAGSLVDNDAAYDVLTEAQKACVVEIATSLSADDSRVVELWECAFPVAKHNDGVQVLKGSKGYTVYGRMGAVMHADSNKQVTYSNLHDTATEYSVMLNALIAHK